MRPLRASSCSRTTSASRRSTTQRRKRSLPRILRRQGYVSRPRASGALRSSGSGTCSGRARPPRLLERVERLDDETIGPAEEVVPEVDRVESVASHVGDDRLIREGHLCVHDESAHREVQLLARDEALVQPAHLVEEPPSNQHAVELAHLVSNVGRRSSCLRQGNVHQSMRLGQLDAALGACRLHDAARVMDDRRRRRPDADQRRDRIGVVLDGMPLERVEPAWPRTRCRCRRSRRTRSTSRRRPGSSPRSASPCTAAR